ncbi:MAG: putative cytidine/deoxycytidine deaminase [Acidimicrobiales bacterium]|nr:putative cytidine/deoxycytidine deaminase [Acidimicrobiales bacterium]
MTVTAADEAFLRRAIEVAAAARAKGNLPFGAVLAVDGAERLVAENTVLSSGDVTGHAEIELVRLTAGWDRSSLAGATLYASSQPCPMCIGSIAFSGIGRVVFGVDAATVAGFRDGSGIAPVPQPVTVEGPVLVEEAMIVHEGFWPTA